MNTGWWNYVILFGIPVCFFIGIIIGGVNAFKAEQPPPLNPNQYRS